MPKRIRRPKRPARRLRVPRAIQRAEQDARLRALHAVALMRHDHLSLSEAARREGTTTRTVLLYGRKALRRRRGMYEAKPIDALRRPMRVLTERGLMVLDIPSSRTASRLSSYWRAVDTYLQTGDRRALSRFAGTRFRAEGHLVPFITDPHQLDLSRRFRHRPLLPSMRRLGIRITRRG